MSHDPIIEDDIERMSLDELEDAENKVEHELNKLDYWLSKIEFHKNELSDIISRKQEVEQEIRYIEDDILILNRSLEELQAMFDEANSFGYSDYTDEDRENIANDTAKLNEEIAAKEQKVAELQG